MCNTTTPALLPVVPFFPYTHSLPFPTFRCEVSQAYSVLDRRRAGVLLHITSLPGGIHNGDLGKDAHRFVDFLAESGFSVWQTLPINPTHQDASPYQCLSAHAGNPLMIHLSWLVEKGWLKPGHRLSRRNALRSASHTFFKTRHSEWYPLYERFLSEHGHWLPDYALFSALRDAFHNSPWQTWPITLRQRRPSALEKSRHDLAVKINQIQFEQFVFFQQWNALRTYAKKQGIILFGDIPIFVSGDSADVWARQEEFDLYEDGQPRVVAGVPPDYFSSTGQRWGNPHYNWAKMKENGFTWWLDRFRTQLELYDWVRIDHFRGLEAYWEIPAESDTAISGRWVKAPGEALLSTLFSTLGCSGLPVVAEDLGIITPEVEALRNRFNIPGMLILQFAFDGGSDNPYLPIHHTPHHVVYTGTHDNDTTLSWYEGLTPDQKAHVARVLGVSEVRMPDVIIDCAFSSPAKLAMIPMQDILKLGGEHRMNTPGTTEGNWHWRFRWEQVRRGVRPSEWAERIRQTGRYPDSAIS